MPHPLIQRVHVYVFFMFVKVRLAAESAESAAVVDLEDGAEGESTVTGADDVIVDLADGGESASSAASPENS